MTTTIPRIAQTLYWEFIESLRYVKKIPQHTNLPNQKLFPYADDALP
jgi:hypothetical protein